MEVRRVIMKEVNIRWILTNWHFYPMALPYLQKTCGCTGWFISNLFCCSNYIPTYHCFTHFTISKTAYIGILDCGTSAVEIAWALVRRLPLRQCALLCWKHGEFYSIGLSARRWPLLLSFAASLSFFRLGPWITKDMKSGISNWNTSVDRTVICLLRYDCWRLL